MERTRTSGEQMDLFPASDTSREHQGRLKTEILYRAVMLDATQLRSRLCSRRVFSFPFHMKRTSSRSTEILRRGKISFLGVVQYR